MCCFCSFECILLHSRDLYIFWTKHSHYSVSTSCIDMECFPLFTSLDWKTLEDMNTLFSIEVLQSEACNGLVGLREFSRRNASRNGMCL